MSNINFYDELDLRYPEIAVCIDIIDRTNPGVKNFYIPVLTPNVDTTSLKTKTEIIRQTNSGIANEQKPSITSIQLQNYIPIPIPRELCAYVGGDFNTKNTGSISFKSNGTIDISGRTGSGGSGDGSHSHSTLSGEGSATYNGSITSESGVVNSIPVDTDRYIPAGSKWIVVFIGGDINKPQIIGRYTEY